MTEVIGVKFRPAGKVYYFDPAGLAIKEGDDVIVETARGLEFGMVSLGVTDIKNSEVVHPLKPVVRLATEEDCRQHAENVSKKKEALEKCQFNIDKHQLEMKLIDVEYTFDNKKIIFYFSAEGRIDFRDLVKDLASAFHMRIELRQIGVRDEAKMLGGIGNCGRNLCCHQWMHDFQPVSIKMAKIQNLSLNPTKISGICGRLMCCLKYENDIYEELSKGMPKIGERIKIREGEAIVVSTNVLCSDLKCRLITEEPSPQNDMTMKLSTEIYDYQKNDIKRLGKNKKPDLMQQEELTDEIREMLKD